MAKIKMQTPPEAQAKKKIGIIAGSGNLPEKVIHACRKLEREVFVLYIDSDKDKKAPAFLKNVPHATLNIGAVGKAIKLLKKEGVRDLVLAGNVKRPSFSSLRPDAAGIKLLAKISQLKFSGDNNLLSMVIEYFEKAGFHFIGVDEVVEELLVPEGVIGEIIPKEVEYHDIELGKKVAHAIGSLDIGQSVIVQQGVVLGIEAAEGTDALIERCASLQQDGRGGILVKMKKPIQDHRVDLPTIGINTIINAHEADLRGIAIEAGGALIIDREEVAKKADTLGLFIVGI